MIALYKNSQTQNSVWIFFNAKNCNKKSFWVEHDEWLWHLKLNCHIHFRIYSRSGQTQNSPKPGNEIFFAILELSFGIFTKGTKPQCIENSKSGPTAFDLYVDPVLSIAILIWIICLEHRLEDKMVRFGQSCSLQHLQSSLFSVLQARWNVGINLKW